MSEPDICPAGYNCAIPENTAVCENGTYAYESIACHQCSKGFYCTGGFEFVCANGTRADATGLSECLPCPDGNNCADPKNPFVCENGTIPSGDRLSCVKCEVGHICTQGKQTSCKNGTYCDTEAMFEPIVCPFGHFCTGGNHKEECGKGKYSTKGSSSCEDCKPGQQCEETVQEKPNWCPKGYHCNVPSQKVACPPGTLAIKYNLTKCEDCPVGANCDNPNEE